MKDNNPSNLTPHHYKLSFFVDLGGKKKRVWKNICSILNWYRLALTFKPLTTNWSLEIIKLLFYYFIIIIIMRKWVPTNVKRKQWMAIMAKVVGEAAIDLVRKGLLETSFNKNAFLLIHICRIALIKQSLSSFASNLEKKKGKKSAKSLSLIDCCRIDTRVSCFGVSQKICVLSGLSWCFCQQFWLDILHGRQCDRRQRLTTWFPMIQRLKRLHWKINKNSIRKGYQGFFSCSLS